MFGNIFLFHTVANISSLATLWNGNAKSMPLIGNTYSLKFSDLRTYLTSHLLPFGTYIPNLKLHLATDSENKTRHDTGKLIQCFYDRDKEDQRAFASFVPSNHSCKISKK